MNISRNEIQQIYCDESGFTGNHLRDGENPFFAYATVAVSHEEAIIFVEKIIRAYKVQGGELKFQNLIKYSKGRKAILEVIDTFSPHAKVTINDKKYSLACKFYEYIFDPILRSKNSIFYGIKFHNFISNILYTHFQAKDIFADEIFKNFENLMRKKDDESIIHFFDSLDLSNISLPLDMIRKFCLNQRDFININLNLLNGTNGENKWILDLTQCALFSLLGEWGKEFTQLEVLCDISKPLQDQPYIFQSMIGREEKVFLLPEQNGQQHSQSFNLIDIPRYVNSKLFPGVQIADIFAGSFTYMFRERLKGKECAFFKEWAPHLIKCGSGYSVVSDQEYIDLENISVNQNYLILEALANMGTLNVQMLDEFCNFLPAYDVHSKFGNFLNKNSY
jgi:Protein of unknown function (DUF3800)